MDGRASSFERVFDARDVYKSASVSPFLGLPTHHRDGLMQKTHRHVSFSLSLCSPSRSITTTITAERHVRRRRLGHRPVEKDEKSVQKVLLPWRRPRTTPRIENRQLVDLFCARQRRRFRRGLGRKPLALVKKLRKAKRGSRDGQARNDQNALEKHDHSAGDDWRYRRRV